MTMALILYGRAETSSGPRLVSEAGSGPSAMPAASSRVYPHLDIIGYRDPVVELVTRPGPSLRHDRAGASSAYPDADEPGIEFVDSNRLSRLRTT